MEYTELKARSYYSFLHGASSPRELVECAMRLGLRGLALSDLGGVYGLPKAWQAVRENSAPDFRLISGAEIPILDGVHSSLTLLAPTRASYGALCRILTRSHEGRPKGTGGLERAALLRLLQETPEASGILLFPEWEGEGFGRQRPQEQRALEERLLAHWRPFFELRNPVWVPLARRLDGFDRNREDFAARFTGTFGARMVAVQDALFHAPEAQILQDTLSSIREGVPLAGMGLKLKRNAERRLKSPMEMEALFSSAPELLAETMRIRERCVFQLSELRYSYPSEWIPKEHTAQSYLEALCREGILSRYPKGASDAVHRQLQHELSLIAELRFADYFLTVYDIVAFARSRKILCQGRGSAANSVVCYVLGITAIDPVRMNLLFERFLSVERGEPPDIDVDFEHERREEVIQYIYQKYGRDRAAMVSAVVTYQPRSALREVAKAFSLPVGTLSARAVEKELLRGGAALNEKCTVSEAKIARIREVVTAIMGFPRHLSIHSGGFTLSSEPIDTMVPVEPATMEGRTIIQWDKYDLDILGLLKIDVLALGMLSAIRKNLELVGKELHEIPAEDPETYDMICRADTIGVFQIESRAQMSMLPRLKPRSFYDLVVEVALVRPGPIVGNMVHPYLRRRRGLEPVNLPDARLVPILGRTYGVPIFQEQVMKMAVSLAGFTAGEADRLRKAIGAWRSQGSMDEMGLKLSEGLRRAGIPDAFADVIFEQIKGFSEYGFPESHAASFALLTYVSSYLKCHHPAEFLCALLNSQPMGFYSPHTLIDDAKRHGVRVLPVSIADSDWDCTLVSGRVRLGLRYVKGIRESSARAMIEARLARPFSGFQDFIARTDFDFRSLRLLAMSGAFSALKIPTREALFRVLSIQEELFHWQADPENGNGRLSAQSELFPATALPRMNFEERVIQDYSSLGLSTHGHPMAFLRKRLLQDPRTRARAQATTVKVKARGNGAQVILPGLSVVLQRPPTAKGTAFATLEDEEGVLDLILHREIYQKYREVIREEAFFWVKGELQRDGDAAQVVVKAIEPIFSDLEIPIAPGAHALRY
jgi:error-prone DNA polymerase